MGTKPRQKPECLPTKLLAIRQKLGLSQSEFVRLLGLKVSAARVSEYESGTREPPLLTLLRYAQAARISTDKLIDDDAELIFPKNMKAKQMSR